MKNKLFTIKMKLSHWMHDNLSKYKLCFVKDNTAYFTTQKLKRQDGDFWSSTASFHKCSPPFEPTKERRNQWGDSANPKWGILYLTWTSAIKFTYPVANSCLGNTVEEINCKKKLPWITGKDFKIYSGVTPKDFVDFLLVNEIKNIKTDISHERGRVWNK